MDETASRDALLQAMLPDVPFDGWSRAAMAAAARRLGIEEAELVRLFPRGPRDAVAWFSRWADRRMLEALERRPLAEMKVRDRIAAGLLARLELLLPHREAARRAASFLALPANAGLGLKLLYDTVSALWYAAGDTATDFNFYTKRALLAGVCAATTLYWLDDRSLAAGETEAFLRRRLDNVLALPRIGARLRRGLERLPDPVRLARRARQRQRREGGL